VVIEKTNKGEKVTERRDGEKTAEKENYTRRKSRKTRRESYHR